MTHGATLTNKTPNKQKFKGTNQHETMVVSCLKTPTRAVPKTRPGNTGARNTTTTGKKAHRSRKCASLLLRPLLEEMDQEDDFDVHWRTAEAFANDDTPPARQCHLTIDVVSERTMAESASVAESRSCASSTRSYLATPSARSGGGTYATTTGAATALWKTTTILNDTQRV